MPCKKLAVDLGIRILLECFISFPLLCQDFFTAHFKVIRFILIALQGIDR